MVPATAPRRSRPRDSAPGANRSPKKSSTVVGGEGDTSTVGARAHWSGDTGRLCRRPWRPGPSRRRTGCRPGRPDAGLPRRRATSRTRGWSSGCGTGAWLASPRAQDPVEDQPVSRARRTVSGVNRQTVAPRVTRCRHEPHERGEPALEGPGAWPSGRPGAARADRRRHRRRGRRRPRRASRAILPGDSSDSSRLATSLSSSVAWRRQVSILFGSRWPVAQRSARRARIGRERYGSAGARARRVFRRSPGSGPLRLGPRVSAVPDRPAGVPPTRCGPGGGQPGPREDRPTCAAGALLPLVVNGVGAHTGSRVPFMAASPGAKANSARRRGAGQVQHGGRLPGRAPTGRRAAPAGGCGLHLRREPASTNTSGR